MKRELIVVTAAAALVLCVQGVPAQEKHEKREAAKEGEAKVALVPKGYQIEIELDDTLDSRTAHAGQSVHARLAQPIMAEGRMVVPEGTRVTGKITEVNSPKAGLLKASIKFKLDEIQTHHHAVPIEASAHLDVNDLAMKGGKAAGTMAAKEVAKSFIPILGTVYLVQNIASGIQFVTEEKEITIPAGTRMKLCLDKDARIPAGR
ncbi:MAG: hypothetical protein NT045_03080 [Candidatus Aureabacteria bacterium]|nr:hypothetical protein [Candidatus Auribacterota bacterium]